LLYVPRAVTLYVGGSKNSRNFWVPPRIVMCRVALTVTELLGPPTYSDVSCGPDSNRTVGSPHV